MMDKSVRFVIVFLILFIFWIMLENYKQRNRISYEYETKIDSLKNRIKFIEKEKDSLFSELYPAEIELNRFHIAFRILEDRNPKAAEQLGNIISEETE